ncbi:MAG TPA: ATP-binding protein [Blastocatellia bacterium]|nr:ATP-binding protein [Blastocatellia bacterium]
MSSPFGLSDRIIILSDETKSAHALERLLEADGYGARALTSFQAARDSMKRSEISLLVLNLSASRIKGSIIGVSEDDSGESLRRMKWAHEALDFVKEVRSSKATSELPVLVISKSQTPQDKVACLNVGASDYITRPYQRAELLSRVRAHLRSWNYERERTDKFEQLNVLHAVSSVLASSLDPDVLVRGTLSVLVKSFGADMGAVFLRNSEIQPMNLVASEGFDSRVDYSNALSELYARTAPLMNGKPLLLEPLPDSGRKGLVGEMLQGVNGLIFAPIGLQGKTVGAICLLSRKQRAFAGSHEDLILTICNQLSVALENARLYVETRKSAAQLSFVYNLGNNLMTSLEMDELLGYSVFTVGKSLECDVCAVVVKSSADPDSLISARFTRLHDEKPDQADWYHAGRINAYLETSERAIQPPIEIRYKEGFLRDHLVSSETIVPLVFDDSMLGALICGSYTTRSFSADDHKLLGAVAQQLSLAIRNTELYRRTKDTSINLAVEVSRRTQEIEEQKRFTEKIIDSLPVSLYVVDRDMRIVAWNRNREVGGRGISREEVLGKNVFQVLTRQRRRMLEDEFTAVFRSGDLVRMEQESWIEGQKKVWKISKIPMRVDNAEVTHVITVGEDITEQKKMNEAVIHAEKLASIGRLAAGVVHEINNPLATISACAEALTARMDDLPAGEISTDFSEYLQIIRDEAFRCKAITNSLLDFSHQRQADKLPGDINQIIEQTLHLVKHHPKLGKMAIIKELDPSLTPVFVNEGQMKQIFIALISNAFDAMEGDGTLTIRTRWVESEGGRSICAEFIDTGCGIPASCLAKIFDPFFTTKPLGRGTGLGLSVCYGIVSEHGGKIEVVSTEGQGSTFQILLPMHCDSSEGQVGDRLPEGFSYLEMEGAL